jgi:hypothetical protein
MKKEFKKFKLIKAVFAEGSMSPREIKRDWIKERLEDQMGRNSTLYPWCVGRELRP